MKQYMIELAFTEPLLGTAPLDKEIYTLYIAEKKADMEPDELNDEVDTIREEKGMTGFHRTEFDTPFLYDYMIRGFFKDACGMLRRDSSSLSKKLSAYKRVIDGLLFVEERQIPITVNGEIESLERPLRAETAQGPRVALAKSEMVAAGSSLVFTLTAMDDKSLPVELIEEWLAYGRYRGLGQWRNGGYGRFSYSLVEA